MLFQLRTVYITIHIVPSVRIVGANAMLVEPTYKHPNLQTWTRSMLSCIIGFYNLLTHPYIYAFLNQGYIHFMDLIVHVML